MSAHHLLTRKKVKKKVKVKSSIDPKVQLRVFLIQFFLPTVHIHRIDFSYYAASLALKDCLYCEY